jgi:photosystem II stability/assembly factor-like uncharacterized protein
MQPGRPLSYPQTHLHTLALSSRPGVVYLGTHYGIFTSTDGGRTWPQSEGGLNTSMITSIAVSPDNPDLVAVLAVPTSGLSGHIGIYVSANAGQSWNFSAPAGLPTSAYPYSIQSAAGADGHFYAFFSFAGWFETLDLGRHWHPITGASLANIQTPSLLTDPANPAHLLMGGDLGLFETRDDGQHWQQLKSVSGNVLALAATSPNEHTPRSILVATDQGLYRWQEAPDHQPQVTQLTALPAASPPTRMVMSADGRELYALCGSDLWFSGDQGTGWVKRWHFTRGDLVSLVLDPGNARRLLAGFYAPALVLVSADAGSSWQTLTH